MNSVVHYLNLNIRKKTKSFAFSDDRIRQTRQNAVFQLDVLLYPKRRRFRRDQRAQIERFGGRVRTQWDDFAAVQKD